MTKKLTVTLEDEVYAGLHKVIGRHRISRFIQDLLRPHVVKKDLEAAYREMAADEAREKEALEWAEAQCGTCRLRRSASSSASGAARPSPPLRGT